MMEETKTYTTESGAFYRKTWRIGKKRKTKTVRITKNDKKVILGHIGEFEVYVYPYDYPDRVFIGQFPVSTQIEATERRTLMGICAKICHYLAGTYFKEPNWRKGANSRKRDIQKAYNNGLNELKRKKKA